MSTRLLRPVRCALIPVVLTLGCAGSIHSAGPPTFDTGAVTYDPPHDIIVLSDPPGAKIVVDAETLTVAAPLTVRHTRKRQFGIPVAVSVHAIPIVPGQCPQYRIIPYDHELPDSIVFRMSACPNPDQNYSRVFDIEEVLEAGQPPERLGGRIPWYPGLLQRARRGGIVIMQVVIDTTGIPEPGSFRIVVASDSGFIQSARTALLAWVYKPGRVMGHKVQTRVTQPIIYEVRSAP